MTLPTKDKYLVAVEDLKKLNNDVFLADLKTEIEEFLDVLSTTSDNLDESYEEHSKKIIRSAQTLLKASDKNLEELRTVITEKLDEVKDASIAFIQTEKQLLQENYEPVKQMIYTSDAVHQKIEQELTSKYNELDLSLKTNVEQLDNSIKSFIQQLEDVNVANRGFLKQNEQYVKLVEEHVQTLQQQVELQMKQQRDLDEKWQGLLKSYHEKFDVQEKKLDKTLVVREQELVQNVQSLQERFQESQKERISALEKSNSLQAKLLIGVIVLQGIILGVGFIM
ncbi:hypothetical protein [Peribacillus frigoritolerans]|uniref:hypothetical protein n=1 Tax=Peribacillus frigoritolerans TaxID=450367 RepID=UPI00342636B2